MKATRAIIIQGNNMLVMRRLKEGAEYYTLVGGRLKNGEDQEEALKREVKEETGLDVTSSRLVYIEKHPEPYNEQYIYLCDIKSYQELSLQSFSEEALLNKLQSNIHDPFWVDKDLFGRLQFRTPQLQKAIIQGLKEGFPSEPIVI